MPSALSSFFGSLVGDDDVVVVVVVPSGGVVDEPSNGLDSADSGAGFDSSVSSATSRILCGVSADMYYSLLK
jgi:hypothetical protein